MNFSAVGLEVLLIDLSLKRKLPSPANNLFLIYQIDSCASVLFFVFWFLTGMCTHAYVHKCAQTHQYKVSVPRSAILACPPVDRAPLPPDLRLEMIIGLSVGDV